MELLYKRIVYFSYGFVHFCGEIVPVSDCLLSFNVGCSAEVPSLGMLYVTCDDVEQVVLNDDVDLASASCFITGMATLRSATVSCSASYG